ncbi:MAG: AraC family transcriptional regulator [Clostridiales bacterium]|nr:AraC family transcriptional regulator [Clostridiales bacterium]MDY4143280.1 AraC family transcriptional regulator [Oscillospiraceae bacterium]
MTERYKYSNDGYLNEDFRLFHLKDSSGQEKDFHFHEFDKIVILISGKVDYTVEGTTYKLEPWDILLVRHHMIHKAAIDLSVPYERIIIYLDSAYVERFAPEAGLMDCFAAAEKRRYCLMRPDAGGVERLKEALERLEKTQGDELFGAQLLRGTMLVQLLVLINRIALSDNSREKNTSESGGKIAPALSYINENLTRELSIDDMAAMCYMSRYYFMRLFKTQTGCTVHNYIRQKRLVLAARLIREGMSASAAAAECGFSDYSAFHRAFTKTFRVSPGKIKKQ